MSLAAVALAVSTGTLPAWVGTAGVAGATIEKEMGFLSSVTGAIPALIQSAYDFTAVVVEGAVTLYCLDPDDVPEDVAAYSLDMEHSYQTLTGEAPDENDECIFGSTTITTEYSTMVPCSEDPTQACSATCWQEWDCFSTGTRDAPGDCASQYEQGDTVCAWDPDGETPVP